MKDSRLLVPLDAAYAEALGRAVFVFARLEWSAVWICQKLAPGYINSLGVKTAGRIAIDLIDLTSTAPNAAAFAAPCAEFKRLVDTRNKLLHGKPGTAPNGDQNLFDRGSAWTIDKINDAADEFASCDRSLNPLMHSLP